VKVMRCLGPRIAVAPPIQHESARQGVDRRGYHAAEETWDDQPSDRRIRVQDPYTHHTDWPKVLGRAALVLGALALVAGVVYFMVPAHSLPSVMGRLPKASAHRTKRGLISVIAGAVLAAGGGLALFQSRRAA
jgi:hypothetical protein